MPRSAPTFELWEFGIVPRPSLQQVLMSMDAVQKELKITDAQKKEQAAIERRHNTKLQQARRENRDRQKFLAARDAIFKETAEALRANLKPEQHRRLDQIQLQAQGPLAFAGLGIDATELVGPPLAERLKLTDDQVRRSRPIVERRRG